MKPESFIRFFQELKRRRVFRGIVVYGASTLILLEPLKTYAMHLELSMFQHGLSGCLG